MLNWSQEIAIHRKNFWSIYTQGEKTFEKLLMILKVSILWFRNGLRFHDNESLAAASSDPNTKLLPLFIFDGETPTTK